MANLKKYGDDLTNYIITTDEVAASSGKNYWDMFNPANSGIKFVILALYCLPKTDVAVSGAVSVRFDFYRTSTAGTGGTGALSEPTQPNVPLIARTDTDDRALSNAYASVFFRSAPTGGATIKSYLIRAYIFSEETNAATNQYQHFNLLPDSNAITPIVVNPGEGLLCKQGTVASVNSYTWQIVIGIKI